jgi:tetratricopeptide (TPR) repeat protein
MEAFYLKGAKLQAYREADQFIKANSKNSYALNIRGRVNVDLGRTEAAFADYKNAMTNDPYDENAYLNRGRLYTSLKQPGPAFQDFNRAVELAPKNGEALYLRAQSYYQQNKFENAITDLLKAIDLTGKSEARLLLIRTYDRAGYKPLADLQHKYLLKFTPEFEGLKELTGRNPGMETQYTAALAVDLYEYNVRNWLSSLNNTTRKSMAQLTEFTNNLPKETDARNRQINSVLQDIDSIIYYTESIERESRKILAEVQTFSSSKRQEIEKVIAEMLKVKADVQRDKKRLEDLKK